MTEIMTDEQAAERIAKGVPVVEFDHVCLGFEEHQVLKDISFKVAHGETRIILGPSGGGKSVLMKLANGLLLPDTGDVRILGWSLQQMTQRELFQMRAHVGMVFQESALFDSLNVEDNVAYRLEEEHVDPSRDTRLAWWRPSTSSSSRRPSTSSPRS